MNISSPDITILDYTALFDISGVLPEVVVTNASSVVNPAALDWWVTITTPSGATIHSGSQATPDINNAAFTTLTFATWPMPNGQVEFGLYNIEVFVKDSADDVFSLAKSVNILRPTGNTNKVRNSFGVAAVIADMRCEKAQLYVEDTTSLSWNGITPAIISQKWVLIYPLDDTDTQPPHFELDDSMNGLIPVSHSGEGYKIIRTLVADYLSNGITVRIKYKYSQAFAVECDLDLCPLVCEYENMVEAIGDGSCDSATRDKLVKINALINIALIAKSQPLCGINVGKLINQIKALGNFCCDCGPNTAGINGAGTNGSLDPGAEFNFTFEAVCGDLQVHSFQQIGNNVVLRLKDKTYTFATAVAPANSLLAAFSFTSTLSPDGCTRAIELNIDTDLLDDWMAASIPTSTNCCPEYVEVMEKGTGNPLVECPGPWFPKEMWTPDEMTSLGVVEDTNQMISKLIGDMSVGGWGTMGIWVASGYCQAVLYRNETVVGPVPKIPLSVVNVTVGPCINNERVYTLPLVGYCDDLPSQNMIYPFTASVKFGISAPVFLSNVTSYSNLLTQLNSASGKPAYISFSAAPLGDEETVTINDTNCAADMDVLVTVDPAAQVLYGAATNMYGQGLVEGVYGIDPKTNTQLDAVCGTKNEQAPWHMVKHGDYMYYVQSNTGILTKVDVSVPMYPVKVLTIQLPQTVGGVHGSFGPDPRYFGDPAKPSYYDVYFPTDLNSPVSGFLYIVESSSGSIWKYDVVTDVVVDHEYSAALIGRCPRFILNGNLYMSQDGSRELDLGLSSGVARNALLEVDLSSIGTGTLLTSNLTTIVTGGDEPWAISWDAARARMWVSSRQGTLVKFDPVGGGIDTYPNLWNFGAPLTGIASSHIFGDRIYLSGSNIGTRYIDLTALTPATSFDPLLVAGVPNDNHYNFIIPQGACYGMVTFERGTGFGTFGGAAKYTPDGALQNVILFPDAGNMYNVVPLLNVNSITPNGLCP